MPIVTLREGSSQTQMTVEYSFAGTLGYLVFHRTLGKSELDSHPFESIFRVNSICQASAMR